MTPANIRKIDVSLARVGCMAFDERADWRFMRGGLCALVSLIALSGVVLHLA